MTTTTEAKKNDSKKPLGLKPGTRNNPGKGAKTTVADAAHVDANELKAKLHADNPSLGAIGAGPDSQIQAEPPQYDVGEDVFDVIADFGTDSSRVAWKAIAHGALATAIFSQNFVIDRLEDNDGEADDTVREAQYRVSLYSDLYYYAADECKALADNPKWDFAMTPVELFDFMVNNTPRPRETDTEVFEATLKAMDVTGAEAEALRKDRERTLIEQATKNQNEMRSRRAEILDEIQRGDARFDTTRFSALQHLRFYKKVHEKLRAAGKRSLKFIGQYENAVADALSFDADAKRVDKCMVAFRRRNRAELLEHEARSAD